MSMLFATSCFILINSAGGQTPEDCRNLCVKLEEAKVDFIGK